jgi:TonB family protein
VEGVVIIEIVVGVDGYVQSARVVKSIPLLDQAALNAAKQLRYAPTIVNGKAIPRTGEIPFTFTLPPPLAAAPQSVPITPVKPEWQIHLDWASNNLDAGGSVDCPLEYDVTYPECVVNRGRACMMGKAREAAVANNCSWAVELSLIAQCNNDAAQKLIKAAGETAVCEYLGPPTRTRPPSPATPTPPPSPVAFQFTCVFSNNGRYSAWFNGRASAFIDAGGQVTNTWIGKTARFESAPFVDCKSWNQGTPIPAAMFQIDRVSACQNLVTGAFQTIINSTCPR